MSSTNDKEPEPVPSMPPPTTKKKSTFKKRPQCARCKKKLTCAFKVCACNYMYCPKCVSPRVHRCPELKKLPTPKNTNVNT